MLFRRPKVHHQAYPPVIYISKWQVHQTSLPLQPCATPSTTHAMLETSSTCTPDCLSTKAWPSRKRTADLMCTDSRTPAAFDRWATLESVIWKRAIYRSKNPSDNGYFLFQMLIYRGRAARLSLRPTLAAGKKVKSEVYYSQSPAGRGPRAKWSDEMKMTDMSLKYIESYDGRRKGNTHSHSCFLNWAVSELLISNISNVQWI